MEQLDTTSITIEWFASGIIEGKIQPQWLRYLKEGQNILILQPMALNDDYIQRTIDYVRSVSSGTVVGIVTIIDGSGRSIDRRSQDPPEKVLIELDLNKKIR
jgi:hypothetical protein